MGGLCFAIIRQESQMKRVNVFSNCYEGKVSGACLLEDLEIAGEIIERAEGAIFI